MGGPRNPALSARVEFIDLGWPSTGPAPYILDLCLCVLDFFVIIHACDPIPFFTDPSDAPTNFPDFRVDASFFWLPS